jgi:hypothetical protein
LIDPKDNLHLIWSDSRNDPNPGDTSYIYEIFYKKYNKNGKLVVDDTRLTDATGIDILPSRWYVPAPSVGLDSDGNIHVAYQDYTKHKYANNRINVEIYYMKLAGDLEMDGLAADRTDLVLTDEQRVSEGGAHSGSADMVIDSEDNVHIVWYDHRSAWYNWEIYYEKLSKNGQVLIDDMRLTYYLDYCAGAEIAVDSNDNIIVAFKSYDWDDDLNSIYFMRLSRSGSVAVNATKIIDEGKTTPHPYYKGYPLIVVDSEDNVHMAWHDERYTDNFELSYLKLSNNGVKLMAEPMRITQNSGVSSLQSFAIDSKDRLYFGWRDNTPSVDYQIYIAILNPDRTFSLDPYQVTASASLTETPSFAFDSHGYIHIAFMDTITFHPEIYHILLRPLTIDLAFVPTGMRGGEIDIKIYEDETLIEELTVVRTTGNPVTDAVYFTLNVDLDNNYTVEVELCKSGTKESANGAIPLKLYVVENGDFVKQLIPNVVNSNSGKTPKQIAIFDLDDFINDYF